MILKLLRDIFHQLGVNFNDFYISDNPLKIAIKKGWVEGIKFLLEIGADINFPYDNGWTPLMLASSYGQTEVIDILLLTY